MDRIKRTVVVEAEGNVFDVAVDGRRVYINMFNSDRSRTWTLLPGGFPVQDRALGCGDAAWRAMAEASLVPPDYPALREALTGAVRYLLS